MNIPGLILTDSSFSKIPYTGKLNEMSWILCLEDEIDGVICITNISSDTKKYKEFNDDCILYIAPIVKNNLFCIPADTFYTVIGCDPLKILRIDSHSMTHINNIPIKTINISQKLDYEFYNDLVYNNKLNLKYSNIIETNGIYKIQQIIDVNKNKIIREISTISDNIDKLNRFHNTLILPNILTSSICDWMRDEITKQDRTSTIVLDPSRTSSVVKYLEFFINSIFINEFYYYYDISLDDFSLNIHGYVLHMITNHNEIIPSKYANFLMDIAITDVKGYYHFVDGTRRNLKKGDCIIYANVMQIATLIKGNDAPYILRTHITIESNKPRIKNIY